MNYKTQICQPLLETFEQQFAEGIISHCCEAPIYFETDICSNCGEHCKPLKECPYCDDGYKRVKGMDGMILSMCTECHGTGNINIKEV